MALPSQVIGEPPFVHHEIKMAALLGLSRDEIRALRQEYLTEGTHFKTVKKRLYLSEQGVNLLLSKKTLPRPAAPINTPPSETAARPRQLLLIAPFEGDLLVWQKANNPRILLLIYPHDHMDSPQFIAQMQVRDNKNFVRGMKVRARHIEGVWYEHVGNLPRWRGKY